LAYLCAAIFLTGFGLSILQFRPPRDWSNTLISTLRQTYAPTSRPGISIGGGCPISRRLLLAKITDMVNNHKSKWPHCDFMRMAEASGLTVCDLIVKIRNGPMVSTKWKEAHHAPKRYCFWIVCRNGMAASGNLNEVSEIAHRIG